MDFKGQTAVLSAMFVLVGMMFPATTEKALAGVNGVATIECKTPSGPRTWLGSCEFTLVDKNLQSGKWVVPPTPSGATIKWQTTVSTFYHNDKKCPWKWIQCPLINSLFDTIYYK